MAREAGEYAEDGRAMRARLAVEAIIGDLTKTMGLSHTWFERLGPEARDSARERWAKIIRSYMA
jgi:hypothetical protein